MVQNCTWQSRSRLWLGRWAFEVKLWEKPVDTASLALATLLAHPGESVWTGPNRVASTEKPGRTRPRNAHKGLIRAVWFPPLYSLPSCHGKGIKTSAESFLIDTGIDDASIWSVAQRPLTKGVDFPDPRRHGCHWWGEKSRGRSLSDKRIKNTSRKQ
jgi:hypothetical protein